MLSDSLYKRAERKGSRSENREERMSIDGGQKVRQVLNIRSNSRELITLN